MAASISVIDVTNGYTTTVPDDELQALITIVDEVDGCLDAAGMSEDRQRILKIYAVRHMAHMQANAGQGVLTSQTGPSGASRSFKAWQGKGLDASPYGNLIKQLDSAGCIRSLLQNDNNVALMVVGACR